MKELFIRKIEYFGGTVVLRGEGAVEDPLVIGADDVRKVELFKTLNVMANVMRS